MILKRYTPHQLLARVRELPERTPISDTVPWSDHHHSHKEHWEKWLDEYESPGYYNRRYTGGRDAAFIYNHLQCGEMLVWLAEAAGVNTTAVKTAAALIQAREIKSRPALCKQVRLILPWSTVCPALMG